MEKHNLTKTQTSLSQQIAMLMFIALNFIALNFIALNPAFASSFDDALSTPNPLGEIVLGAADAPVTVVEYASLTCSHCGDFHNNVLPTLKRDYVDTGKVKFYFRPFPLDPFGTAGAMLAQCAPVQVRTAFLGILFQRQTEWTRAREPMKKLQAYARQMGMSGEEFSMCLHNQEVLEGIRTMQSAADKELGVNSTPTFFINGEKVEGNVGLEKFRSVLDEQLREKGL